MDQEQLEMLQSQIDSGELDPRTMDAEQQSALKELIRRGEIKAPPGGVSSMIADRDVGEAGILQQAQEASKVSGLQTPFGEVLSERASFELVGDVIGSFAPYLTNRRALVKDIVKGVGNEKYTKPMGKESFRAGAFANQTAKFTDTLKNLSMKIGEGKNRKTVQIGKAVLRGSAPGRALAGTIGFLEKAIKSGTKIARGEIDAVRSGDATKSLMRTGARTEAKSLVYGAVGAGTGSAIYDLVKFKQNLGSNLSMDLGELTTDEIDDLPFAGRLAMHSALAMKNSLLFGAAGTGIGILAAKGFKAGKKTLLGLNSEESMNLARKAFEEGTPLSPTALAGEGIGGFLSRNFFQIFGVTPLIGGKGTEKLRGTVRDVLFPNMLKVSAGLEPNTTAVALTAQGAIGAETMFKMAENYKNNKDVIDVLYKQLLIKNNALGSPSFIPTTNFRKELAGINKEIMGEDASQFAEFLRGQTDTKNLTKEVKDTILQMIPIANADQLLTKDNLNLFEAAQYRRFLTELQEKTIGTTKTEKGRARAEQIRRILAAMDQDMALAENVARNADLPQTAEMANYIALQKGANDEQKRNAAGNAIKALSERLHETNDTYFKLVNAFDGAKKGFYVDQILGAALFNAGTEVTAKQAFDNMFDATFKNHDHNALKQIKRLIGVNEATPKKEYADAFMKKLGVRYMFDAFNNSFTARAKAEPFVPNMILNEDIGKAEDVVRKIIEDKPNSALAKNFKNKDPNKPFVDQELMALMNKKNDRGEFVIDVNDRAKIQESLTTSLEEVNLAGKSIDNFNITTFKNNLGLNTPDGVAMLEELYGKEHTKRIKDVVEILEAGVNIGLTDPSTFITRRIILSGTATAGIGASLGFFGGGDTQSMLLGGSLAPVLSAFAARRYGMWIADPNTTKAALGLLTDQEKKFLIRGYGKQGPLREGVYTRGIGQSKIRDAGETREAGIREVPFGGGPFGIVDPTKPLGQYYGPQRARNLAIMMNYFTGAPGDDPTFTAQNITMKDVNDYFAQSDDKIMVPNPSVSLGQLPESTIRQMYPEYEEFKKLSIEEKKIFNDQLRAALAAKRQGDIEEDEIDKMPDVQQPQQEVPPANIEQTPPAAVPQSAPQAANQNLNMRTNYAALFPQDDIGQALANRGT